MSDMIGNAETQAIEGPCKARLLAICTLSIAAVMAPVLVVELGNLHTMPMLFVGLFYLVLDLTVLSTVLLLSWSRAAGDLEIVWRRHRRSEVRWAILLLVGEELVGNATYWGMQYLGFRTRPGFEIHAEPRNVAFVVAVAIHSAILGPALEEIFWRGCVQRMLERIVGGIPALVGQAIPFATMHMRPFGGFIEASVFGLILGAWRWRRRTLLPVILAHITVNTLHCAVNLGDWIDAARVRTTIDYIPQMNDLSKPAHYDPADDARQDYERAVQLAVRMPDEVNKVRSQYPTDWTQDVLEATGKWVQANAPALEHLAQGARKPYYWPICEGEDAMGAALPPLAGVRRLAWALSARIKLEAHEANEEPLVSDVGILYRFGAHFAGRKTVVHQIVGTSLHCLATGTLRGILAHESLPPQILRQLQEELDFFKEDWDFTMDFSLDHLVWLDSIQRTFTDEGDGRGHIPKVAAWDDSAQPDHPPYPSSNVRKKDLLKLNRRDTTRRVEEFFLNIQMAARKTPWQLNNEPNSVRGVLTDILEKDAFVRAVGFGCFRPIESPWRDHMDLESLVATLATIRYKADHGQYPDSLKQLVETGYLKHAPQDSYSNGPLIYKQVGNDFLLYSCGADFDDDGGVPSEWGEGKNGGDQVFWPVSDPE